MNTVAAFRSSSRETQDDCFIQNSARRGKQGPSVIDSDQIFRLQLEQREHDEKYHPEIARLTMHHRLNHMALHFAKYTGRVAHAARTGDDSDVDRTLTDFFVIALSSANVLNTHLGKALFEEGRLIDTPIDSGHATGQDLLHFLFAVSSATGRMAKACESLDHIEPVDFREEMKAAIIAIADTVISYSAPRNLQLLEAVHSRLEGVRASKIFHGYI